MYILVKFDFNRVEMRKPLIDKGFGMNPIEYNFSRRLLLILEEYRKDATDIPSIFLGLNLSSLIMSSNIYTGYSGYRGDKIKKKSINYIGDFAGGCKVYLDFRLKPNEILVGKKEEITSRLLKIDRRKKIRKLNLKK